MYQASKFLTNVQGTAVEDEVNKSKIVPVKKVNEKITSLKEKWKRNINADLLSDAVRFASDKSTKQMQVSMESRE